jgi:pimeloyl-ACP methyl ester carboxylesterase
MSRVLADPSHLPVPGLAMPSLMADFTNYWIDAAERWVLFTSVLQERGQQYLEHAKQTVPHVLKYDYEVIANGRDLPRPVNYGLVRIKPPSGVEVDEKKRPFVIVDPRAGHGPGIGGFKADSEIGVAMKAGHPCYFIGFLPEPLPGQTIEDVIEAKAAFLERVNALHKDADGRPAVIGNCQAGWAIMMVAARRPELFGPLIVAGSPLSYWAGVHGANPMRYTGGLLGGSWLTALTSDLGNGKFDGAWLVSNFENLNPSNTFWTKLYNVYSNVDKERDRFLEFEQWWGGHVTLNGAEIQFIVDELFVGNKLAEGSIVFSDGRNIDLRNIKSPIVVFCSKADNITPPPQALDWILDLYSDVDQIKAHGQTIVYAVHEAAGHLAIFVSGAVAKKEHQEFASNIDLIDVLPPGLYEAVMTPKGAADDKTADLIVGEYLVRFEARTLDDIRALGCNSEEDDHRFSAVARLSEINLGLYRTFVQPWIRMWTNEQCADWLRQLHPLRLQYTMFAPSTPMVSDIAPLANHIRANRHSIAKDNYFLQLQDAASQRIERSLDAYRDVRDWWCEALFHGLYGSATIQACPGLKASEAGARQRKGGNALHDALVAMRIADLKQRIREGGPREATIRAALYIRMPEGVADERGFQLMERMRSDAGSDLTLATFKALVRQQYFTLLVDRERAIEAIPDMLAQEPEEAERYAEALHRLLDAVGVRSEEGQARRDEIEEIFHSVRKGGRGEKKLRNSSSAPHHKLKTVAVQAKG